MNAEQKKRFEEVRFGRMRDEKTRELDEVKAKLARLKALAFGDEVREKVVLDYFRVFPTSTPIISAAIEGFQQALKERMEKP